MNKKRLIYLFSFPIIGFLLISFHNINNIFAQNTLSSDTQDKIKIYPVLQELYMNTGEKKDFILFIENNSQVKESFTIESIALDKDLKGNESNTLQIDELTIVKDWINIDLEIVSVEPNTKAEINYSINIPLDTQKGIYYPALLIKSQNDLDQENFAFRTEFISVNYINVKNSEETYYQNDLRIDKFNFSKFLINPENQFEISLTNYGNTFIKPKGVIEIYDNNGTKLSQFFEINENFKTLLPQENISEIKTWKLESGLIPKFGKYNIVVTIYDSYDNSILLEEKHSFYIIPIYHLIGVGIVLIIIFFLIKKIINLKVSKK